MVGHHDRGQLQTPILHPYHPPGLGCHLWIVGDQDDGLTLGIEAAEQLDDLLAGGRVQAST